MELQRRHVQVGPARIHFATAGAGFPLVLIHGLSGSTRWWRRNVPALAQHFRVHVIDLIGFGGSRRGGPFVLHEAARVLADWMRRLRLDRAHVVGHSMGGYIAADLTVQTPEHVDRLVLVDAAAFPLERGPIGNVLGLIRATRYMTPSFLPVLVTDAVRAGPIKLLKATREVITTDLGERCRDVQAPSLVVWGEFDRLIPPEAGRRLARCLPNARLVVIEGAGHLPMWDRPQAFDQAVLDFLAEADETARSTPLESS